MSFGIVINEASLPFGTAHECSIELVKFFKIIHQTKLEKITLNRAEGDHGSWSSFDYSEGFQFGEWIANIQDKDTFRMVTSVVCDIDCSRLTIDSELKKNIDNTIYALASDPDVQVDGLGTASLIGAHAISFKTDIKWEANPISVVKQWDEGGRWKEEVCNVPNITSLNEVNQFLTDVVDKRQSNRSYLKSLQTCHADFPNVVFFDNALKNLKSDSVSVQDFPKVIEVLNALSKSIEKANNLVELSSLSGLSISGESAETMKNRKYARQRDFKSPSGQVVCCEVHVKNFPGGKRMHVALDYVGRKVNVGYFGTHLPTKKHPK